MKYTLSFYDKNSVPALVEIITGGVATPVEVIEGGDSPIVINYKMDNGSKGGNFMQSSADITIYESGTFRIDNLATSSELDIKVNYYINSTLYWTGYVLPDFFSREIGDPAIINMTATDRLGAIKNIPLLGLAPTETLMSLITKCLNATGLSLSINATVGITADDAVPFNVLDSKVNTQRIIRNGQSISCYDVMDSILTLTNSTLRQRSGAWEIYNKAQHELLAAGITFDDVTVGARREIVPVASSTGVFHEHGGGALHPDNYDFSIGLSGWTDVSTIEIDVTEFDGGVGSSEILGYVDVDGDLVPVYGAATTNNYLVNNNIYFDTTPDPELPLTVYPAELRSSAISIPNNNNLSMEITVDINAIAPLGIGADVNKIYYRVVAEKGSVTKNMTNSGGFTSEFFILSLDFNAQTGTGLEAATLSKKVTAVLEDADGLSGYSIYIYIYGSRSTASPDRSMTTFVNYINISFSHTNELPAGNIYKVEQGAGFTRSHGLRTSIFGDYIRMGLNGYFYDYLQDDTSSLFNPDGEHTTLWITTFDSGRLPLLQHIARERARLFSRAHSLIRCEIDTNSYDPIWLLSDCGGRKYVMVSAAYDFFRSTINVEIEECADDPSILRRDFIYSSFGDDDTSSVSGVSSIGSGSAMGGGLTSEQLSMLNNLSSWWMLDEDGNLYTNKDTYSTGELSAYGVGTGGGGGGGGSLSLLSDVAIDSLVATNILQYDGTHWVNVAVSSLPGNATWGSATVNYSQLSVSGVTKSVSLNGHTHIIGDVDGLTADLSAKVDKVAGKSLIADTEIARLAGVTNQTLSGLGGQPIDGDLTAIAALSGTHGLLYKSAANTWTLDTNSYITSESDPTVPAWAKTPSKPTYTASEVGAEPAFAKNTAFNKNFGTTAGTVAEGNHTHTFSSLTGFPTTLAGYGITDAVTLNTAQTITGAKTFSSTLTASTKVVTPIVDLGNGWRIESSAVYGILIMQGGSVRARFESGGFVSTGDVTAYI